MTRIIVCGGRDYVDRARVWEVLDGLLAEFGQFVLVIHGRAIGADALVERWALVRRVRWIAYPADWVTHGKAAGPIRNRQMLDAGAGLVVAFPGGCGTADMVQQARARGVPVREV